MRLFVALRPPRIVREGLLTLMGGISGARWQDEDQLHINLRFIGEVDRHQAADVHAALGGIHHAAFTVALNGVGVFERKGTTDVLWAGVTPREPPQILHNKIDQSLVRVAIAPEHRAFHPHVTLARLDRSAGPVHDFLGRAAGFASLPFEVAAFGLFESRLTPEGAIHTQLERYPLGPAFVSNDAISLSTRPA
jgi:2'-5' RNA ligase